MKLIVYLINFEGKSRTPTGEATGYLLAGTQYNTSHRGEVYCESVIHSFSRQKVTSQVAGKFKPNNEGFFIILNHFTLIHL